MLCLTFVHNLTDILSARLLTDSLRTFGGPVSDAPVWVFHPDGFDGLDLLHRDARVRTIPTALDEPLRAFPFAYKPRVASLVECMMPPDIDTVIWLDCSAVILKPPLLLTLDASTDIALRPVHVRNIGSPVLRQPDEFWTEIYTRVGASPPASHAVEPFTENELIRPYFNCCTYSIRTTVRLFGEWWDCFQKLACDSAFLEGPCRDDMHRFFLHQAVFSALVTKHIAWSRIRFLPTTYGYPLHLDEELARVHRRETPETAVTLLADGLAYDSNVMFFRTAPRPLQDWFRAHQQIEK